VVLRGFHGLGGSHGARGIGRAGHGSIYEYGLGLNYLELSPVGDGYGVDQPGIDGVAGVEVGYEIIEKLDEGSWRLLIQGAVGGGEAVAGAVAGRIAFSPGGSGSSGTGTVEAGGLDLF
jgi:hypothetical protein